MFFNKSKKLLEEKELESALMKLASYEKEFKDVIEKNTILAEKNSLILEAERKLQALNNIYQKGLDLHQTLEKEISLYQESFEISSYGLHQPQYSFDTSEMFKIELEYGLLDGWSLGGRSIKCPTYSQAIFFAGNFYDLKPLTDI